MKDDKELAKIPLLNVESCLRIYESGNLHRVDVTFTRDERLVQKIDSRELNIAYRKAEEQITDALAQLQMVLFREIARAVERDLGGKKE